MQERTRPPNGRHCIICANPLTGRQQKVCGQQCRSRHQRNLPSGRAARRRATAKAKAAGKHLRERECWACGKKVLKSNYSRERVVCSIECRWFVTYAGAYTMLEWRLVSGAWTCRPTATGRRRRRFRYVCCGCAQWFSSPSMSARTCSTRCRERVKSWRRQARLAGAVGSFDGFEWRAQLKRYGNACAYCHQRGTLQLEHVIPLSRGGTNRIANVVPACGPCNVEKGTLTAYEWMVTSRPRVAGGVAVPGIYRGWPIGEVFEGLLDNPAAPWACEMAA